MKVEKTMIIGIGQPEMDKIIENGYFEYILKDGGCLRLVWEDKDGKMDERGLMDVD